MQEYRVQLDVFSGPLDLLLYLIRRDELDIQDISLSRLTDQYLEYIHVLELLDPNQASDFLVMASTLIEMKSRAILPTPPLDGDDDNDDPRAALVRELLEYKRFKDAAARLGSAAEDRAKRYVRRPANLPPNLQGVELEDVELWDLVSAFHRVMTAIGEGPAHHDVTYDDTPIELYGEEIMAALERDGPATFEGLFEGRTTRAEVVGLFLAVLELIRKHRVDIRQERNFGTIHLFPLVEVPEDPIADEDIDSDDSHTKPDPTTTGEDDAPPAEPAMRATEEADDEHPD